MICTCPNRPHGGRHVDGCPAKPPTRKRVEKRIHAERMQTAKFAAAVRARDLTRAPRIANERFAEHVRRVVRARDYERANEALDAVFARDGGGPDTE